MLANERICLVSLVAGLVTAICHPVSADISGQSKTYETNMTRIKELGEVATLTVAQKQQRITSLEELAGEIEREWRETDVDKYARLQLAICGTLGGLDLATPRRSYLRQAIAMRALEKGDGMPLDVECALVRHVQCDTDVSGKSLEGEGRAELRKTQAMLWFHAWKRIATTIDKKWDPEDLPLLNVAPPEGTGLPSGVAPDAIADPELRSQYIAAIEANRQKIATSTLQRRARYLEKYWIPWAKRFLIRSYMQEPDRTQELQTMLGQYVADAKDRAQVLDAVRNKKMPEELEIRITTRKADAQPPQTQPAQ